MPQTDYDRVIALAGLVQATSLVRDIAQRGLADAADIETCLTSLVQVDAATSAHVYGDIAKLRTGLQRLAQQLENPRDTELTHYVITLLSLERKLTRRDDLLAIIRNGIQGIMVNLAYFSINHSNTIARFADIYLKTISTLSPRIMVKGSPDHLSNTENTNQIRALLLAGIRAAMLWRQSGGSRLTLLLRRNPLLRECQRLQIERP
ncbi:MAG: lysogenization regulator HflD [Candidatus Contendobacter odensis]|uniref:High frequency lysogenization protein HflD homolog n=1 Tax=Candidatus Contendibacter odensensis TaxID=1400860 RepID=A0A2G6PF72_9GAMM|nr:MAG: lysogenization regulator HflD [Candidatus Contendobacter odensis]